MKQLVQKLWKLLCCIIKETKNCKIGQKIERPSKIGTFSPELERFLRITSSTCIESIRKHLHRVLLFFPRTYPLDILSNYSTPTPEIGIWLSNPQFNVAVSTLVAHASSKLWIAIAPAAFVHYWAQFFTQTTKRIRTLSSYRWYKDQNVFAVIFRFI